MVFYYHSIKSKAVQGKLCICVSMCARVHMCVGFNTNYGGLGRLLFCFLRQSCGAHVKQIRLELTGIDK